MAAVYKLPEHVSRLWDAFKAFHVKVDIVISRHSTLEALEAALLGVRRMNTDLRSLEHQLSTEVKRLKAEERESARARVQATRRAA